MGKGPSAYLRELAGVAGELAAVETQAARLAARRDRLMVRCRETGVQPSKIAAAAGVSAARVSQVAPAPAPTLTPAAPVEDVPRLPAGAVMMSGAATRAPRTVYTPRVTVHADLVSGDVCDASGTLFVLGKSVSAAALLGSLARLGTTGHVRVMVTRWGMGADERRAWAGDVDGWDAGRHWTDRGQPVYRWQSGDLHAEVTTAWWGRKRRPPRLLARGASSARWLAERFPVGC